MMMADDFGENIVHTHIHKADSQRIQKSLNLNYDWNDPNSTYFSGSAVDAYADLQFSMLYGLLILLLQV